MYVQTRRREEMCRVRLLDWVARNSSFEDVLHGGADYSTYLRL